MLVDESRCETVACLRWRTRGGGVWVQFRGVHRRNPSFFFQAEDGIRDHCVTGVQTCALPISEEVLPEIVRRLVDEFDPEEIILFGSRAWGQPRPDSDYDLFVIVSESEEHPLERAVRAHGCLRSEERRVGKECRDGWSPYHLPK